MKVEHPFAKVSKRLLLALWTRNSWKLSWLTVSRRNRRFQPYDRIAITAACPKIPPPLLQQLAGNGRLIAPVLEAGTQKLVVLEKNATGITRRHICQVLYVNLRGLYGVGSDPAA